MTRAFILISFEVKIQLASMWACEDDPAFATYTGGGFTGQAGFLLIEDRAMLAFRHSRSADDSGLSPTSREWAVVLQIFHLGNRSKFTLEGGAIRRDNPEKPDPNYMRLQYQLLL